MIAYRCSKCKNDTFMDIVDHLQHNKKGPNFRKVARCHYCRAELFEIKFTDLQYFDNSIKQLLEVYKQRYIKERELKRLSKGFRMLKDDCRKLQYSERINIISGELLTIEEYIEKERDKRPNIFIKLMNPTNFEFQVEVDGNTRYIRV